MFRNEYTAKIGFTRVLDRTCSQCGGLYSSNEKSHCPKCQQPLIVPTHQTESGPRPYCFTEVTLYPMMRQEAKDKHSKRTAASKGLLFTIRMTLWGRYDKVSHEVQPDARTRYLVPKRTIRVLFNNPPTLLPFIAKADGSQRIELKYTFDSHDGDQIEFLDAKQTADANIAGAKTPTPTPDPVLPAPTPEVAVLQQQMTAILTALQGTSGVLPAPDPTKRGTTLTDADDYEPNNETVSREVSTDPFVTEQSHEYTT